MKKIPLTGNNLYLFFQRMDIRIKIMRVNFKGHILSNKRICLRANRVYKEKDPNLDNPTTFSDKLIYLKMYYRNPLMTVCSDKYFVSDYVKLCGYENILRKFYGVYDNANQIDFDKLPEKFFIRCNHMSGCNYLVEKDKINYKHTKKLFNLLLKFNYSYVAGEWSYKNIQPKILIEEVLENPDKSELIDYKFYCFDGIPRYFMISKGELNHNVKNHKFNMKGESIDYLFKKESSLKDDEIQMPSNLNEMIEIVDKLCKPFPHVRVDLYNINGKIIFGELTFYSNSGSVSVYSEQYDKEIGSWIDLKKYNNELLKKID